MKFVHFSYLATPGVAALRPHELRDGDAFVELSHALTKLGHEYGGLIINHPEERGQQDSSLKNVYQMSAHDFLVLTTRPPLNDRPVVGQPKPMKRSETALEHAVFDSIRKHLSYCTRNGIQLNHRECVQDEFLNRADMGYYVKTDRTHPRFEAAYHEKDDRLHFAPFQLNLTTAGYLLHAEPIVLPSGKRGPRVLVVFGVSGTIGLALAYLLRTQPFPPFRGLLKQLLTKPSIVMVEISVPEPNPVPQPFRDLHFVERWKYQIVTKPI
ncbi:MAG: hypothetical protein LAO20_03105 [Acidobacteriia bacterium]|nr:hypothetical protein [Terriglobia bacterium]